MRLFTLAASCRAPSFTFLRLAIEESYTDFRAGELISYTHVGFRISLAYTVSVPASADRAELRLLAEHGFQECRI